MSNEKDDLGELLERVQQHDEDAARVLVERLHPLVARIVRAHLPPGEDEQDLRQEAFLKIFSRLDSFRGTVPFEHWVSRVTLNTCIDQLRARRARPAVVWSDLSPEQQHLLTESSAEESACPREQLAWDLLQRLLESLAPAERLLIRWVELEEKSITEVCALKPGYYRIADQWVMWAVIDFSINASPRSSLPRTRPGGRPGRTMYSSSVVASFS